jgi:hypothetical protein
MLRLSRGSGFIFFALPGNLNRSLIISEIRFKPTALEGGTIIVTMHRETHCSLISPGNDRCPTKCENQYFINF